MNAPTDERAAVAAEAQAEREREQAAEASAQAKAEEKAQAQQEEAKGPKPPELGLDELARFVVEAVDLGARAFDKRCKASEPEKAFLALYTRPVLEKHLPATMQAVPPEYALLAAVAIVYGSKLWLAEEPAAPASSSSSSAPSSAPEVPASQATVDGQATAAPEASA